MISILLRFITTKLSILIENYDYNKYWVIHCRSIVDKLIEVYHTVDIKEIEAKRFYNVNFDFVLSIIGNYYKKEEDTSSVYSIAYDVIVKDANINNKKKVCINIGFPKSK